MEAIGTELEQASQFLTFTVREQEYGIEIQRVHEIRAHSAITPIPSTPPHVRGVINLRGVIVPVYDLRVRFGLPPLDDTRFAVIVVVNVRGRVVGLLVDAVSDVLAVAPDAVQTADRLGAEGDDRLVQGIVHASERIVVMLRLDGIVDEDVARERAAS